MSSCFSPALPLPEIDLSHLGKNTDYRVALVNQEPDIQRAQELRYQVFNVELKEGLAESVHLGRDVDAFDAHCEHLLVWHRPTQSVVGTYRLQTGAMAQKNLGYYSAQEFDFAPFEKIRAQILELGRACVHLQHRNLTVLHLLWRGIAHYARQRQVRYFIGCSSLTTQDDNAGWAMYRRLCPAHLVEAAWQTEPWPAVQLHPTPVDFLGLDLTDGQPTAPPPKLLRAYLALGAKICGAPAKDREFKTIDFLTLLDLESLPVSTLNHFFA